MERRDALKLIGASLILGGGLISARALSAKEEKVPPLPWPYKKLDPEKVAERAYLGYYKGGCCYGAFDSIVGSLQDTVGYPYTGIPTELFVFGEGGWQGFLPFVVLYLDHLQLYSYLQAHLKKKKGKNHLSLSRIFLTFTNRKPFLNMSQKTRK